MSPPRTVILLLALASLLAACSGGSEPREAQTPPPVQPAPQPQPQPQPQPHPQPQPQPEPEPSPAPQPDPVPEPPAAPAVSIDLRHWRLTIPADASGGTHGKALTIENTALVGVTPYESDWFYRADDGALTFWVPVNGAIGGSSTHPRSELREMLDPLDPAQNWYSWQDSTLVARCAVEQVPSGSKRVMIGQVHAYRSPQPLLLLQYDGAAAGGTLSAVINPNPDAKAGERVHRVLATGIALGEKFNYRIRVAAGVLRVEVNGNGTDYRIGTAWSGAGHYFKAGAYILDTGRSSTDGAQLAFYKLNASHQ